MAKATFVSRVTDTDGQSKASIGHRAWQTCTSKGLGNSNEVIGVTSGDGKSLLSAELARSAFDVFPTEEIDFAVYGAELLADAQVIDDLQIFAAILDSGVGKASIVGGYLDEDAEALTL